MRDSGERIQGSGHMIFARSAEVLRSGRAGWKRQHNKVNVHDCGVIVVILRLGHIAVRPAQALMHVLKRRHQGAEQQRKCSRK